MALKLLQLGVPRFATNIFSNHLLKQQIPTLTSVSVYISNNLSRSTRRTIYLVFCVYLLLYLFSFLSISLSLSLSFLSLSSPLSLSIYLYSYPAISSTLPPMYLIYFSYLCRSQSLIRLLKLGFHALCHSYC